MKSKVKYISKAPFRIGLAGGGTDVSPFSDTYGGAVLNTTVNLYATVTLIPREDDKVCFKFVKSGAELCLEASMELEDSEDFRLQIGVYNRMVKDYVKKPIPCDIITDIDVPTGSGLGTSSTIMVALIGAFSECFKLPLGEYDMAQLAVSIERHDLQMLGGKQDQYAATFGGFNFMEFYAEDRVVVNPLRIKSEIKKEIEYHLLLFYTQTKRESSKVIEVQTKNFENQDKLVLDSTLQLKEQAYLMKEAILKDELDKIGEVLRIGWENKKHLAQGISNPHIDEIYETGIAAGATGGKISGAGGGGFMVFYCPENSRYPVIDALDKISVKHQRYSFQNQGIDTWTSYQ